MIDYKNTEQFKNVSESDWNDWKWQLQNSIKDINSLEKIIELDKSEKENLTKCLQKFRMAITPYYAALMDKKNKQCPVRLQAVPRINEMQDTPFDIHDPLSEAVDSPVEGLTHRYPDRVLFLVTNVCSMNCRHCTRRRIVGFEDSNLSYDNIKKSIEYIKNHKEVRDVLISGGDPLILEDDSLEDIIKQIRAIPHVEIIRLGTRIPVVMPMRITDKLVSMLKKYHPIYVNTHFNHPKEITKEAQAACNKLSDAGVPMGNQSVLLRGINDCPAIMKKLVHQLMKIRVKPYYIYQCDMAEGISHFRTSVACGMEIIENLRGHTTGMSVPTYVVDAPYGGGKIPVMPNYLISLSDNKAVLRNYEGVIVAYTQPENYVKHSECEICKDKKYLSEEGIAGLMSGKNTVLEPSGLLRKKRR